MFIYETPCWCLLGEHGFVDIYWLMQTNFYSPLVPSWPEGNSVIWDLKLIISNETLITVNSSGKNLLASDFKSVS